MRTNTRAILLIVLISLIVGLIGIKLLPDLPLRADAADYHETAIYFFETGDILKRDGTEIIPLGYPFVLSILYSVFGVSFEIVQLFQFLCVGIIAATVFLILRRYFNTPLFVALFASLVIVVWPYMLLYATLLLTEVVSITLFLFSVYFLLEHIKTNDTRPLIYTSVILALLTTVRPAPLLLVVWISMLLIAYQRFIYHNNIFLNIKKIAMPLITPFVVVLIAYSVLLYAFFGVTNSVTDLAPNVFSKAFVTMGYETSVNTPDTSAAHESTLTLSDKVLSKTKNIYRFWNPGAGGTRAELYAEKVPAISYLILLYKFGFFTILALAFLSLRWWKNPSIATLWIVILYFWALHSVLFPYPRYMLPLVPLLIILATITVSSPDVLRFLKQIRYTVRKKLSSSSHGSS